MKEFTEWFQDKYNQPYITVDPDYYFGQGYHTIIVTNMCALAEYANEMRENLEERLSDLPVCTKTGPR